MDDQHQKEINVFKQSISNFETQAKIQQNKIVELQKENNSIRSEMKQEKVKLDQNIEKLKKELESTVDQYQRLLSQNINGTMKNNKQLELFNNTDGIRNGQSSINSGQANYNYKT
jgi:molecular chaperone GrpE (heat shock protein)